MEWIDIIPDVACIINEYNGDITKVNTVFNAEIAPSDRVLGKMNWWKDFFAGSDEGIVDVARRIACEAKGASKFGTFSTMTLQGENLFPVFVKYEWQCKRVVEGEPLFLFTGRKLQKTTMHVEATQSETVATMASKACAIPDMDSELVDFFYNAPIALHWLGGDPAASNFFNGFFHILLSSCATSHKMYPKEPEI